MMIGFPGVPSGGDIGGGVGDLVSWLGAGQYGVGSRATGEKDSQGGAF